LTLSGGGSAPYPPLAGTGHSMNQARVRNQHKAGTQLNFPDDCSLADFCPTRPTRPAHADALLQLGS